MKIFAIILFLVAVIFSKSTAQAADSSLEIVLCEDQVVFTTSTNISMAMIFRNVGATNLGYLNLLDGLSVVLDGKEYKRDPKWVIGYNGSPWIQPKSGWRHHISFSEYQIPPAALVTGRHTVALRVASSESNTQTIFIEPRK